MVQVNTGFYFAAPTAATKKLLNLWLGDMRLWEQSSMWNLLKSKSVPDLDWKSMPSKTIHSFCHAGPQLQHPVGNHVRLFRCDDLFCFELES
jgi:hypothetical protein